MGLTLKATSELGQLLHIKVVPFYKRRTLNGNESHTWGSQPAWKSLNPRQACTLDYQPTNPHVALIDDGRIYFIHRKPLTMHMVKRAIRRVRDFISLHNISNIALWSLGNVYFNTWCRLMFYKHVSI